MDPTSINIFEQINSICREFRRDWKNGKQPRIEDFLPRVSENARSTLFSNLIQLEIRIREKLNENPTSSEYVKRFPELSRRVRQAFDESTNMSVDQREELPAVDLADFNQPADESGSFDSLASGGSRFANLKMPAARRIGDYELVRELGRGGMGVVYEARHLNQGNRVALKTLPTGIDGQQVNAERLYRFRKEFRSLSEINHPNLVGMQTLEVDGGQWFFTMDLIDGMDFLDFVRPDDHFDERRLRDVLPQLVHGISELHRLRIVHRDLKPSNVLVDTSGRVSILDFGLVAEMQQVTELSQTRSGMFAGTPRYAAPEQMFGQRSEASDWYALGVMLYEALTGQLPYNAKEQMELMRQKHQEDPPLLSDRDELPDDLARLVDGLIRREPKQRLLMVEIFDSLGINLETVSSGSTAEADSSTGSVDELELTSKPDDDDEILIGREEQLAQLEAGRWDLLDKKEPIVMWITGKSGEGKSSLAEKFLRPLRAGNEMLVLSGRCYDRESVPFKAVDSIIDPLVSFLRSKPGKQICRPLPEDIQFLAQLFPLLWRVEAIAESQADSLQMEPEKIRARAFYALRELLITISHHTPVVVSIDDLQWADADSAQAWMDLLIGDNSPSMLFLGSYRIDEAEESSFLRAWNRLAAQDSRRLRSRKVDVQPLNRDQCIELAALRTGADSQLIREQADELFENTGGNPYFLDQQIEGFDAETGRFRHVPLNEIISGRLQKLPETAVKLLDVIAVSGQPISVEEAAQVATGGGSELATLTHMRNERLVRLVGDPDQSTVDTYHDKIRETVLAGMQERKRKSLHLELGNTIESNEMLVANELVKKLSASTSAADGSEVVSPRIFDLAHHFSKADDPRAFSYQLVAGLAALDAFAMEEARDFLHNARSIQPQSLDTSVRFQVEYAYSRALWGTGSMQKSSQHFTEAMESASSPFEHALCVAGRGHAWMKQGKLIEAKEDFCEALELLGESEPRTLFRKISGIAGSIIALIFVPKRLHFRKQRLKRDLEVERLIASTKNVLTYAFLTDIPALIHSALRNVVLAKFSESLDTRLTGNSEAAMFFSINGLPALGRKYMRLTISELEHCNSQSVAAVSKSYLGRACYYLGELSEATQYLDESFLQLKKNRDYFLYEHFHMHRHIWSIRGDTKKILYWAQLEKEHAELTDDNVTYAYACYGLADGYARKGDCELAMAYAREASDRLASSQSALVTVAEQELGRALLQNSEYKSAIQTLRSNAKNIRRNLVFMELNLDTFSLLVEAVLGINWIKPREQIPNSDRRIAARYARQARFHCSKLPTLRPHCCRVSGRASAASGANREAYKYFDKAIAAAEKIGADYEHARSLIDKSMIDHPNAKEDRQRGLEMLANIGCVLPVAEQEYLGISESNDSKADEVALGRSSPNQPSNTGRLFR